MLIAGFEIDAALNEDHSFDSEVTEHPVESGADIADHVRARPISVDIEGVVSFTPLVERTGRPTDDFFAHLIAIRDAKEPITIETSLKVFENMVLTSLSIPIDAKTGESLQFRATFVQIQLVTNVRTFVRVAAPRARGKLTRGNKPSLDPATAPTDSTGARIVAPPAQHTSDNAARLKQLR